MIQDINKLFSMICYSEQDGKQVFESMIETVPAAIVNVT